jgi:hypothetical protein
VKLAAEIDPNMHSCGRVMPHGARELAHPEVGLYMVGMKSYGRAPTFLAMTGYEQVRSVAAELAETPTPPGGSNWCCRTPGCVAARGCSTTPPPTTAVVAAVPRHSRKPCPCR